MSHQYITTLFFDANRYEEEQNWEKAEKKYFIALEEIARAGNIVKTHTKLRARLGYGKMLFLQKRLDEALPQFLKPECSKDPDAAFWKVLTKWRQKSEHFLPREQHLIPFPDIRLQLEKFITGKEKIFLLLGDPGAGKTTTCAAFTSHLWDQYQSGQYIPILFSLAACKNPSHFLDELLLEEEQELLKDRRVLFIADGYDEIGQLENLYVRNHLAEWPRAKLLITCRSGYPPLQEGKALFAPYTTERETSLLEKRIPPFTTEQVVDYIQHNSPEGQISPETVTDHSHLLTLLTNPFLLSLWVELYPMATSENPLDPNITSTQLLQAFVEKHFEESFQKASEASSRVSRNLIEKYRQFSIDLAEEMNRQNVFVTGSEDKHPWDKFFKNYRNYNRKATKIIQTGAPLASRGEGYAFFHPLIQEYFLTLTNNNPVTGVEREISLAHPTTINLLAEGVEIDPEKKERYWNQLYASHKGRHPSENTIILAANAITVLNAARISFSNEDLSNLQIPNAILDGGLFDRTNFTNADLQNVSFRQSHLREANFTEANLKGAFFGQYVPIGSYIRTNLSMFNEGNFQSDQILTIKSIDISTEGLIATCQLCYPKYSTDEAALDLYLHKDGKAINHLQLASMGEDSIFLPQLKKTDWYAKKIVLKFIEKRKVFIFVNGRGAVWNIRNNRVKELFQLSLYEGEDWISTPRYSPVIGLAKKDRFRILDIAQNRFSTHTVGYDIKAFVLSTSGSKVATLDIDGEVDIHFLPSSTFSSRTTVRIPEKPLDPITSLAFSPSGTVIAVATNNEVVLWYIDATQQNPKFTKLRSRKYENISNITFSTDENLVIAGYKIIVWNINSEENAPVLEIQCPGTKYLLASDNLLVTLGSERKSANVWDLAASVIRLKRLEHKHPVTTLLPGDEPLLSMDNHNIFHWSSSTLEESAILYSQSTDSPPISGIGFDRHPPEIVRSAGTIRSLELPDNFTLLNNQVWESKLFISGDLEILFSPDNRYGVKKEPPLRQTRFPIVFQVVDPQSDQTFLTVGLTGSCTALALSPKTLAIGGGRENPCIYLIDLKTKALTRLSGHTGSITALAWQGDTLFSGSEDQSIKVWQKTNDSQWTATAASQSGGLILYQTILDNCHIDSANEYLFLSSNIFDECRIIN